jgi:hypothetical protein
MTLNYIEGRTRPGILKDSVIKQYAKTEDQHGHKNQTKIPWKITPQKNSKKVQNQVIWNETRNKLTSSQDDFRMRALMHVRAKTSKASVFRSKE